MTARRLDFHFEPGHDNTIGTWNPAWGPRPKLRRAPTPSQPTPKCRLQQVACPGCTADDVTIWGPPATYSCTQCGTPMVSTVVPAERKQRQSSVQPGERYGRLVVQSVEHVPGQRLRAVGLCDCGTVKVVRVQSLRSGQTRSCGCLYLERNLSPQHPWRQSYKKGGTDV